MKKRKKEKKMIYIEVNKIYFKKLMQLSWNVQYFVLVLIDYFPVKIKFKHNFTI